MNKFHLFASCALFALSCLPGPLTGKNCAKCVKIETERAQEQAKAGGIQNVYYEDYIKMHESTLSDSATDANHQQKSADKYKETYNPKTGLYEEELKDAPKTEVNKSEKLGKTGSSEKKMPLALNTALSFKKNLPPNSDTSALFDIFSINDLFQVFEGPFTFFVPTDAALRNYPALQDLFKPENREMLYSIVTNHIVPKQILRGDAGKVFKTLGGRNIELQTDDNEGLSVNGTPILRGDAIGNEGVVYVIDKVLIPIHE